MRARSDTQRIADLEEMVAILCEQRRELAAQVAALELMVKRRARKQKQPAPKFPTRSPQKPTLAKAS